MGSEASDEDEGEWNRVVGQESMLEERQIARYGVSVHVIGEKGSVRTSCQGQYQGVDCGGRVS
jgi:hypothetical protein